MARTAELSTSLNPLATSSQLRASASRLDGVPRDLENSVHFAGARLTQAAGVLLRVPQETVAQAIVLYFRFWVGTDGGSLKDYGAHNISAACVYLTTKLSAQPVSPRNIINVYAFLDARSSTYDDDDDLPDQPEKYYVSEGTYQARRPFLMKHEEVVLRTLGFQTHVSLPFALCINYLQALDLLHHESGSPLAQRAVANLNTALLSPQLLYLTHQPTALATAAIYLAAKEIAVKLPEVEWWEVFDTDREELGFLIVGMLSAEEFALQERERWRSMKVPLSTRELEEIMESRMSEEA